MLCWSWVFGCKMLNLPKGASENDSREVFHACIYPFGVCSMEENLSWSSTVLFVSLTVFFSQAFIANKLKECLCPGGGVRICALAIKAHNPSLQCQEEGSNSFIHKNNFIFLWRGNILSLLLLCLYPFSADVPNLHAEQRDEAGFPELWRGGQGGWLELSVHKAWLCSQSWSSSPLFATAWHTFSFVSLDKTSFIHGASLLTCQISPRFAPLFDRI